MRRALALAALGSKKVKDNPKVGAVLVFDNRIIGEGYHIQHGEAHAEVNCLNSVNKKNKHLISDATLYVTLEPCFHEGKTPPCVDLIIKNKIKTIVLGATDPNPKVAGKSIQKLRHLGVHVIEGILEKECKELIQPFIKMMMDRSPWVQLKFAKSKFNYLASKNAQVWLSSEQSKLYTHRLRSDVDGIMIGTQTALIDDPALTTRLVEGENPVRIILDRQGKLPKHLKVFTDGLPTIYVTTKERSFPHAINVVLHDFEIEDSLKALLNKLYQNGIYRLMVEGGASLLQSFQKKELWDEAVVIHTANELNEGKKAPNLIGRLIQKIDIDADLVCILRK